MHSNTPILTQFRSYSQLLTLTLTKSNFLQLYCWRFLQFVTHVPVYGCGTSASVACVVSLVPQLAISLFSLLPLLRKEKKCSLKRTLKTAKKW